MVQSVSYNIRICVNIKNIYIDKYNICTSRIE